MKCEEQALPYLDGSQPDFLGFMHIAKARFQTLQLWKRASLHQPGNRRSLLCHSYEDFTRLAVRVETDD